jgi:LPS sulfotransferase NodH
VSHAEPYLVLKLARTGSTLLSDVLASHPSVQCEREYLNAFLDAPTRGKVDALAAFYRQPPSDVLAFGQTMNPFKYGLAARDIAAAFQAWPHRAARRVLPPRPMPAKLIVLRRTNALKQAVSEVLAREITWASNLDEIDDPALLANRTFAVDELEAKVEQIEAASQGLGELAAALRAPTLDLSYEELQRDAPAVAQSTFAFLEVPAPPAGFDPEAGYTKVLSDDLREVVANYDDLTRSPTFAPYL